MLNLIEKFLEETASMRVFASSEKRSSDYQEVYFFMGKDAVLCISKADNKVLYHIKMNGLQINLLSNSEFSLVTGGTPLFFCQDDSPLTPGPTKELSSSDCTSTHPPMDGVANRTKRTSTAPEVEKYPYRVICEACSSKKCSQYDTINGRNFKFGPGPISEDMLLQHDRYCQTKIEKLGCDQNNNH